MYIYEYSNGSLVGLAKCFRIYMTLAKSWECCGQSYAVGLRVRVIYFIVTFGVGRGVLRIME